MSGIDRKLRISLVLPNGHQTNDPDQSFHNLYRVTLKNGEIWAVDPTGAQYGYADPLCPWHVFERRSLVKIIRETALGYIGQKVYQSREGMFPVRQMMAQKLEKWELNKALEESIPQLARDHGGKLKPILSGSDAVFKQAKHKFIDQFEDHVKASVTNLYAPEQITSRNKIIECQLSQSMADPNSHQVLDGMLRFAASAFGNAAGLQPKN